MSRFYTSDHHFGHQRIIELAGRPFRSVEHMNKVMVDNWNDVVSADDVVVHLGDFVMGNFMENIQVIDRLNGTIMLVPGNHDRMSSNYIAKDAARARFTHEYTSRGVIILPEITWMNVGNQEVTVSHYPYEGDSHEDDRYVDSRPENNGQWLLHGHVHEEWQVFEKMINVGVDRWDFTPVHESSIELLIDLYDGI